MNAELNYGKHSLVLCGGGLDSFIAAWDNQITFAEDKTVLLYVDYGCRARLREIEATQKLAVTMNKHFGFGTTSVVVMEGFNLWSKYLRSPLTDNGVIVNTPSRPGIASAWVPARNTVLASLALAMAESDNFARVVLGINKTAAAAYPDNDITWLERFEHMAEYGVQRGRNVDFVGPLAKLTKAESVALARETDFPVHKLAESWSCYLGERDHCGTCTSCQARREAFEATNVADLTTYKESL